MIRMVVYNLPLSDLLQENELHFVSYEDLLVGVVVLAPWKHRGSGIHYSKACIVLSNKFFPVSDTRDDFLLRADIALYM